MPAPPARIRSANVPCGTSSTSSSPLRNCRSNSLFSPTYVETIFCTCRDRRSTPMPNSSTPALLLMTVRPFVPRACSALMRFSGMPHRPKPPIMIVAPSGTSATAASASGSTLFMIDDYTRLLFQGGPPSRRGRKDLCEPIALRQVAAQILKHRDQRVERRSQLVGVGGGDVAPDLGRARRQSRRVREPTARKREPALAHGVADHVHQRTRRQLGKMAEKRQHAVVSDRIEDVRLRAEGARKRRQLVHRRSVRVAGRR